MTSLISPIDLLPALGHLLIKAPDSFLYLEDPNI